MVVIIALQFTAFRYFYRQCTNLLSVSRMDANKDVGGPGCPVLPGTPSLPGTPGRRKNFFQIRALILRSNKVRFIAKKKYLGLP